jgi:hypothetical protein
MGSRRIGQLRGGGFPESVSAYDASPCQGRAEAEIHRLRDAHLTLIERSIQVAAPHPIDAPQSRPPIGTSSTALPQEFPPDIQDQPPAVGRAGGASTVPDLRSSINAAAGVAAGSATVIGEGAGPSSKSRRRTARVGQERAAPRITIKSRAPRSGLSRCLAKRSSGFFSFIPSSIWRSAFYGSWQHLGSPTYGQRQWWGRQSGASLACSSYRAFSRYSIGPSAALRGQIVDRRALCQGFASHQPCAC